MDINPVSLPQDYGPKNPDPYPSTSLLMTLESIMLEINMQIISYKHSNNYTKSQSIGKWNYILHLPSSGVTGENM